MIKIALLVDNPNRDLPGLVLLASYLCRQGAACHLVPTNLQWREIGALAPDFVLLNYLRPVNEEITERWLDAGIRVGILDTEGGVLSSLDYYAQIMAPNQTIRNRMSCFCSWGTKLAQYVRENGWYREDQVVLTGAPRFDFYVDPWREAALRISPYVEEYPKPMVMINSNFPVGNPGFQTPQEEMQSLTQNFGFEHSYVSDWQRTQREAMLGMVELANRLATRFPKVTFIYRPHPFERLEAYRGWLEPLPNLHLVRTGTIDGWLLRASAVIQRSCSTAIEAGLADVVALSPVWIPVFRTMKTAEDVSIPCNSMEELEDKLDKIIARRLTQPEAILSTLSQVVEDWFYKIDGKAYERVGNAIISEVEKEKGRTVKTKNCRDIFYRGKSEESFKTLLMIELRKRLRLPANWSFRQRREIAPSMNWDRSEKYFNAERVRLLVDAINGCHSVAHPQINVKTAQELGNYHFGYTFGHSVTVYP